MAAAAGQGALFRKPGTTRQSAALKYSNMIFNDPAAEDHKSMVQQAVLKGHTVYVRK